MNPVLWAADLETTVVLSCQQDKRVQATGANIAQQTESIQCRVAVVPAEQGREGNLGRVAAAAGAGGGWWKKCHCVWNAPNRTGQPPQRRLGERQDVGMHPLPKGSEPSSELHGTVVAQVNKKSWLWPFLES